MNKYLIAGVKSIINFHHKDFFDSRLKEYESNFLDDTLAQVDYIINHYILYLILKGKSTKNSNIILKYRKLLLISSNFSLK